MDSKALKARTKQFSLRIVKLVDELPRSLTAQTIARQIIRSSTSVAANYRACCRAKSMPDFLNKITIVEEEADETQFWLELLVDTNLVPASRLTGLIEEASQLTAIFCASGRTTRLRLRKSGNS